MINVAFILFSIGNGKTHYIRSQLNANNVVIAVNEMFSVGKVIYKLKFLYDEKDCSIFFNFTLLPPGVSYYIFVSTYVTFVLEKCSRGREKGV